MGRHKRMKPTQGGTGVLGRQLRSLRRSRGLRLVDLGAVTGLSHAFLSQLESGSALPSLSTLWSIADALGVEPGVLLQEPTSHEPFLVRGGGGRVVVQTGDEQGTVVRARSELHHLKATLAEGRLDAPEPDTHPGEEFVYVIDGALEITLGDATHRLEQGDSIIFDGSVPHGYQTIGEGDARILFVFTMKDAENSPSEGGLGARFRGLVRRGNAILGVL